MASAAEFSAIEGSRGCLLVELVHEFAWTWKINNSATMRAVCKSTVAMRLSRIVDLDGRVYDQWKNKLPRVGLGLGKDQEVPRSLWWLTSINGKTKAKRGAELCCAVSGFL